MSTYRGLFYATNNILIVYRYLANHHDNVKVHNYMDCINLKHTESL